MSEIISTLESLDYYTNNIINDLITSPNISKLLAYTDASMYSKEPPINPYELIHKNIFPYGYVPDLVNEVESYITVEFEEFKPTKGNYFMYGYVVISIFSHESLQKTNYGTRLNLLYGEVHKIMNNKDLGIGRMKLNTGRKIPNLQKPYSGKYLVYELVDFNG